MCAISPISGPGLHWPMSLPVGIAGCSLNDFSLLSLGVGIRKRIDASSQSHCLPNSLFMNVCGLALWSVYTYFNFLLTCSVEDLISSFIYLFLFSGSLWTGISV